MASQCQARANDFKTDYEMMQQLLALNRMGDSGRNTLFSHELFGKFVNMGYFDDLAGVTENNFISEAENYFKEVYVTMEDVHALNQMGENGLNTTFCHDVYGRLADMGYFQDMSGITERNFLGLLGDNSHVPIRINSNSMGIWTPGKRATQLKQVRNQTAKNDHLVLDPPTPNQIQSLAIPDIRLMRRNIQRAADGLSSFSSHSNRSQYCHRTGRSSKKTALKKEPDVYVTEIRVMFEFPWMLKLHPSLLKKLPLSFFPDENSLLIDSHQLTSAVENLNKMIEKATDLPNHDSGFERICAQYRTLGEHNNELKVHADRIIRQLEQGGQGLEILYYCGNSGTSRTRPCPKDSVFHNLLQDRFELYFRTNINRRRLDLTIIIKVSYRVSSITDPSDNGELRPEDLCHAFNHDGILNTDYSNTMTCRDDKSPQPKVVTYANLSRGDYVQAYDTYMIGTTVIARFLRARVDQVERDSSRKIHHVHVTFLPDTNENPQSNPPRRKVLPLGYIHL